MPVDSVPVSRTQRCNAHLRTGDKRPPVTDAPACSQCANETNPRFQAQRRMEIMLKLTQRRNAVNRQANPHQFTRPALFPKTNDSRAVQNCCLGAGAAEASGRPLKSVQLGDSIIPVLVGYR